MSKQLPAEWQQKIEDEALEFTNRFKDNNDYQCGYIQGFQDGYSKGAVVYGTQLAEAQDRIKTLEAGINDLITQMETWRQMCVDEMAKAKSLDDVDLGYQLAGRSKAEYDGILPKLKALTPDNKTKDDEHSTKA